MVIQQFGKMASRFAAILLLLSLSSAWLAAQPKSDERARELVSLAKKYYRNNAWKDAAMSFELATQRPTNDLSSYSWYMAGLSYFNMGEYEKAEANFAKLFKEFPESSYLEDAQYHRALILLESPRTNDRDKGLDQIFALHSRTANKELKATVENSVRHFLFNKFELSYLNLYKMFAKDEYKIMFSEAICYQLDKRGEGPKVLAEIKDVQAKGGTLSPYLSALKTRIESGAGSSRVMSSSRLNLAIFLAFHTEFADTATMVPGKSIAAVEMLEGMMIALDSLGPLLGKEINIRVFDTRSDTNRIIRQLDSLAGFNPDIIIGDIRTSPATLISNWAEKRKVLHIIPRNPLNELIAGKKYTFLAHPSLGTHGRAIAEYFATKEGKHSMTVFNDKTYYAEKLSQAFIEGAKAKGVIVSEKVISKEPAKVKGEASIAAQGIKTAGTEVVYVPLSNEESAGMIMSYLNYHSAKPVVAGGPDWEAFNIIDAELKTSFQLKYSTLFFDKNDSLAAITLRDACSDKYSYDPTANTIMGFDIMAWVLHIGKDLSTYNDPALAVHKAEPYHGIHQDFYFGDRQDNQKVNIVQFTKGRIDKVNYDQ